jgi:integrase
MNSAEFLVKAVCLGNMPQVAERQAKAAPLGRSRRTDLSIVEVKNLLRVIKGERLEALYVLALTTGLRSGELVALRWDDVDLRSRQLHVRRTIRRIDRKLQVVELKTRPALRTVMLPRLAVRHLEEHEKRQDGERTALGDLWREQEIVFASASGTLIEPGNMNRRWQELRRRADLNWVQLRDLRRGCATFLLAQGVPPRAIMDVLGRAKFGVPTNTYAHVLPELHQEAADAIDELFGA